MHDTSGVDLCALPAATPPEGQVSNFVDPPSFAPIIIPVCTVMMSSALVVTAGRLFVNRKHLACSDCKLSPAGMLQR